MLVLIIVSVFTATGDKDALLNCSDGALGALPRMSASASASVMASGSAASGDGSAWNKNTVNAEGKIGDITD